MARGWQVGPFAYHEEERDGDNVRRAPPRAPCTKIAQGWPKLWANFRALIGIFGQSVGPRLAIWALRTLDMRTCCGWEAAMNPMEGQ